MNSGELAPLALDGGDEAGVLNGDCNLLGEGRDEGHLGLTERPDTRSAQVEDACDVGSPQDRKAKQGSKTDQALGLGLLVLSVGQDVLDLDRPPGQQHAARHRVAARVIRMIALVGDDLPAGVTGPGGDAIDISVGQIDRAELRGAQSSGAVEHPLKDGWEIVARIADDPEDLGERRLTIDMLASLVLDRLDEACVLDGD